MGRLFAIGDIHGCVDELEQLVERIKPVAEDTLVFLGDYIDRGPYSNQVIELVMDLHRKCNVVPLMGNHEWLLLEYLKRPEKPAAAGFILNGGTATLASYRVSRGEYHIPERHIEFIENLRLSYETDEFFFVHAGVPDKDLGELDQKIDQMNMLWIRENFLDSNRQWKKKIVHGHTPIENFEIDIRENRINLDTACVFGGKLTAMEMKTGEIVSIEKKEPTAHYYLEDPDERRTAKRFLGSVPVFIHSQSVEYSYMALNYNEFGLLLQPTDHKAADFLKPHQKVEGGIQAVKERLPFTGEVMRVQDTEDGPVFGLKINLIRPQVLKP